MTQSGYQTNPRVAGIEASTIRAINALKKPTSIDLGLGEPGLPPDLRFFEAATRWVAEHGCRYTANAGDAELRDLIAKAYRYPELDRAENVVVMAGGSQEAVYVAIKALIDPAKDALLVVEPAFPVYAKCAQMEGIEVERVSMEAASGFAFDADRILAAVTPRTRMIAICSPCNPTARTIDREQVGRLAAGLLARGGTPIYVMHDEVYRELTFAEDAGYLGRAYPHTVSVNSLSKSNALTGMRIGWLIAPAAVVPTIVKAHAWLVSTGNTYAQRVAIEIFRTPGALEAQHPWYAERRALVAGMLSDLRLRTLPIDGTFYVAVHVGDGVDTLAFARRLVERDDVVAIPGSTFGDAFEGWLRCSWVAPAEKLRTGFERIAAAIAVKATP